MALEAEATRLYALLPRDRRSDLYNAVMANPMFPFHDDADYTHAGRYFLIATGNYRAPVSQEPLNRILNGLALNEGYTDAQKDLMYRVYIEEIEKLTGAQYKRRGRNLSGFQQTIGRYGVVPEDTEEIIRSFLTGLQSKMGNTNTLNTLPKQHLLRLKELASRPYGAPGAGANNVRPAGGAGGGAARKSRRSKSRKFKKSKSRKSRKV